MNDPLNTRPAPQSAPRRYMLEVHSFRFWRAAKPAPRPRHVRPPTHGARFGRAPQQRCKSVWIEMLS
eukprot:3442048-Prymnesium_polylepis.1